MWYKSESTTRPDAVNTTMSKKYVYLRKNIHEETREYESGATYTVFVYDECKIPKDVYVLVQNQNVSDSRLDDIEEVLADIIGGGELV